MEELYIRHIRKCNTNCRYTQHRTTHIRSLGVRLDAEHTIESQIADMCKTTYYHMREINKIRKYLTDDTTKICVHSLVTGRLEYYNRLYFGQAFKSIYKLQLT